MTDGDIGALPDGWVYAALTSVAEVIMGQSPPGHTYNSEGIGLPFFQGKADFTATSPRPSKWCTAPSRMAAPGDILMSIRAPVGPTNVADRECAIGRGLAIIRPREGISRDYVRAAIQLQEAKIASWGTGTTFSAVNKQHLARASLPTAPSREQHRIAARLGAIEQRRAAAAAHLQRARAVVERLRNAVLAAACAGRLTEDWREEHTDPKATARLPELTEATQTGESCRSRDSNDHGLTSEAQVDRLPGTWRLVRLGDIVDVATGATPLRKDRAYYDGGSIPWVTSGAVNAGTITRPTELITPLALKETNVKLFPAGTLLIAMYGEGQTRGRVAELAIESGTNQAVAAVLFSEATGPLRPFIRLFFEDSYRRIRSLSVGGVQPNLNLGVIKDTLIPLPSLDEQHEIVRRSRAALATADRLTAQVNRAAATLDRVARAALAKGFRGELVPTEATVAEQEDRDFESAGQLLKRIEAANPG